MYLNKNEIKKEKKQDKTKQNNEKIKQEKYQNQIYTKIKEPMQFKYELN